jgi:AbiV family abortive infection protein
MTNSRERLSKEIEVLSEKGVQLLSKLREKDESNNRGRIVLALKSLMKQIVALLAELVKEKDESNDREYIRKNLEAISKQVLQALVELGEYTDETIQQMAETIVTKNQVERLKQHSGELSKFLSNGYKVVTGPTQKEKVQQLLKIVEHAEGLWDDATLLFKKKRYATACFLSIVCIEECAKINFGMFQTYFTFANSSQPSANPRRRNPLTSHTKKHFLAACSGALVNSRMDRVLGIEEVNSFISDCETGELEKLRRTCLYTDIDQSRQKILIPMGQIGREQALFYICLAGELLAEAGGIEPSTLKRLLDKADKFEKANWNKR